MHNFCFLATFPIFSYQSGPKSIQNEQFWLLCNFSNIFLQKVVPIDLQCPILAILQLFQYFPTNVVQIDLQCLILAILQLFQYFPTEVVQIDSE